MTVLKTYVQELIKEATRLPDEFYKGLDSAIENSQFWLQPNTVGEIDMQSIPGEGNHNQTPAAQELAWAIEDYLGGLGFPLTVAAVSADPEDNKKLDLPVRPGHRLYPSGIVVGGQQGLTKRGRFLTYLWVLPVSDDYDLSQIDGAALSRKIGNIMRHELIHTQHYDKRRLNQKISRSLAKEKFEDEGEIVPDDAPREDYLGSRMEIDAYAHQFAEELLQKHGKEKTLGILRGDVSKDDVWLPEEYREYLAGIPGEKATTRLKKKMYSHIMDLSDRKIYENILRATLFASGELR
tara:strand:+ start:5630 stop:6511 length:882 start_codon:yes stop_codon:yes gene_type:complete